MFAAQLFVAVVALWGIVDWLGAEPLWTAALEIAPSIWGLTVLLALCGLYIQAEKWRVLLVCLLPLASRKEAFISLLAGLGLGLFTPGRIGELGRGLVLPVDRAQVAVLTLADRSISMGITLVWGSLALAVMGMVHLVILCWGLPSLGLGVILIAHLAKWRRACELIEKLRRMCAVVPLRVWVRSAAWSILFNAVFLGQFLLLVSAHYDDWSRIAPLGPALFALKSLLPVSFLDLGVREGLAVWLFKERGLAPLPAFNAALGMFFVNVALPGCFGWFFVGRKVLNKR